MKEKNISSYKLEKLGFSRATYYSIQQGNSISTNTVNQLCKLLKCNVSDIMEYIDDEEAISMKKHYIKMLFDVVFFILFVPRHQYIP